MVDWRAMVADEVTAAEVGETEQVLGGLDTGVPLVLLPVRLETRFAQVEVTVPDDDPVERLSDPLKALLARVRAVAGRSYATVLTGTVREKKRQKTTDERPLYDAVEADLDAVDELTSTLDTVAREPLPDGDDAVAARLSDLTAQARAAFRDAAGALAELRSPYQRERLTGLLDAREAAARPALDAVDRRLEGLTFRRELDPQPAAVVARRRGVDSAGRPLRPGVHPDPTGPRARVVRADGTSAGALGARRTVALERDRLDRAATAARTLVDGLAAGASLDDLMAAAAAIPVLPGGRKRLLLDAVDAATGRRSELDHLRRALERVPSDRPDLDPEVPEHLRDVVFEVARTRTEDRLLVRVYPEALAVDTFEEDLTAAEMDAASAYWSAVASAGDDDAQQRGAWRALCAGRSTRRAAWIAETTAALAPDTTPGAVAGAELVRNLDALLKRLGGIPLGGLFPELAVAAAVRNVLDGLADANARLDTVAALPRTALAALRARVRTLRGVVARIASTFSVDRVDRLVSALRELQDRLDAFAVEPPPPTVPDDRRRKPAAWTRAPGSGVLPARFVVVTVSGGAVSHVVAGADVPADLQLGLDPADADAFALDADGDLVVPESLRWMTDLDRALADGMAVSVPITADEARTGFDELFVVGMTGGDADGGARRLERLLDAHHYTGDGLELLATGTPTNNTEATPAGFSTLDDPDAAYDVERGPSLVADRDADGPALAAALGVDPERFASVRGANRRDGAEARTTTAALYPGTLGFALEELLPGLLPADARDRLRAFVTRHVRARGTASAFRVADQPYGVQAVTAVSLFVPHRDDTPATDPDRQARFDTVLRQVLLQMHADWGALRRRLVAHAHGPDVGGPGYDAKAHFLRMTGLLATSAEASYRFAVNVAHRGGVRGRPDLALSFGVPGLGGGAGSAAFGPVAMLERLATPLRTAFGLPDGPVRTSGTVPGDGPVTPAWKPVHERLAASRAYGLRLIDGLHPLLGVVAGPETSPIVLGAAGWTPAELAERIRIRNARGTPLAEPLAEHALLAEFRRAAVALLFLEGLVDDDSYARVGASASYVSTTLTGSAAISPWGFLFAPLSQLDLRLDWPAGHPFVQQLGGLSMVDYLAGRGDNPLVAALNRPEHLRVLGDLQRHAGDVRTFAALPPERMTPLVREHLDLCSHRLDAWLGGLAERRLGSMRAQRPRGAHVGAYGWVENLRPDLDERTEATLPPALAGRPGRPVTRGDDEDVVLQTPSPAHAVTAAILRGGFAARSGTSDLGNAMSVNLSGYRVRTALSLIDGVRAGNDLGALLGYRFERFLHEYYARPDVVAPAELDVLIGPLRRAFPTVDPVGDAAGGPPAQDPYRERYVVDGLALVRTVLATVGIERAGRRTLLDVLQENDFAAAPWGIPPTGLPPLTAPVREGLARALDDLANTLDALGDVTTSEAVHQIVGGNHARAAAVLGALGEGRAPDGADVVRTPRTGLPVGHRVLLQIPPVVTDPVVPPPGWGAVRLTPRALLEPSTNAWLAALLGDPDSIRLRVVDPSGATSGPIAEMNVTELGLQPLDLLAVLGPDFEAGLADLTARALDRRRPITLEPDQPGRPDPLGATDVYRIDPEPAPPWPADIRGLVDVSALLESVHDLFGRSRAATARDYRLPASGVDPGAGVAPGPVRDRARRLLDGAADAALTLARLLAGDPGLAADTLDGDGGTFVAEHAGVHVAPDGALRAPDALWGAREQWRLAVVEAGLFGVPATPPRRYVTRAQVLTELLRAAETGYLELVRRLHDARTSDPDTGSDAERVAAAAAVARALLGDGVVLIPAVTGDAVGPELAGALGADKVGPAALQAWLEGASAVHEGARTLGDVLVLGEALGAATPRPSLAQLPDVADEPWLGGPLPDADALVGGRLCLTVHDADLLTEDPDAPVVGLVVDEWDEVVPSRQHTSGLALHYDQPDATAPQCVLVAVPPERGTPWRLADVVATLHDTLEIARNRTVEPEHIGTDVYGQVLPLLVGELVPESLDGAVAPDGSRVMLDFAVNNPTGGT